MLELDLDIADTGYDGLRYTVETVELVGATPKEYERKVQVSKTFGSTGAVDVDLPLGSMIRGLQLFGTTSFGGSAPVPSWGRIATLIGNQEVGISSSDFEIGHALAAMRGIAPNPFDHRLVSTGGPGPADIGDGGWQNYAYYDFDPNEDDMLSLHTAGETRFHIRADAETADLVRAVAIEQIKL
jgi:hypothetical protein